MSDAGHRSGVAFIGDAHLDRGDPDVEEFVAFLAALGRRCGRIVFLGDLFNLWLGRTGLEQPHQTAVIRTLETLRRDGVVVRYVEGNRDFHLGAAYAGHALDDVSYRGVEERAGSTRIFAVHGDLANERDRQYRSWSRIARSRAIWALFNLLPRRRRLRLGEAVERRFRDTNLRYKKRFPENEVRRYAAGIARRGFDVIILGHFHVEREIDLAPAGVLGRAIVLPEWKGSRRHLEADDDGRVAFRDSTAD